jgi:hypothetical protein
MTLRNSLLQRLVYLLLALTLAACGTTTLPAAQPLPVDVRGMPQGWFELTVQDPNAPFELEGAGEAVFDPEQGYALYLQLPDSYDGVTFVLPADIQPGSYALGNATSVRNFTLQVMRPGAMITRDAPPNADLPVEVFGTEISGVLTLASVDPLTGAFAFGAIDAGVNRVARGQFNAVPLPSRD